MFNAKRRISWTSVARILDISIQTIKRRLIENNNADEFEYLNITD